MASFLKLDLDASFSPGTGITEEQWGDAAASLEAARREMLQVDSELFNSQGPVPPEKEPLDAGFFEMPERILGDYRDRGPASELGQILSTAKRIRDLVDRVVILGIGGSYMGARALMESCCHPYHNELPRGERGGRPRIYFEGNNVDNDAAQGLLDLLGRGRTANNVDDRWALVVISKSGGTLETAAAFRIFLRALRASCNGDEHRLSELVVPVTGREGKLYDFTRALNCSDTYYVPEGVGGRFSVLSPVGLLPAALMGLDVVRLLEGAAAMNGHFREASFEQNLVMRFAAACHLMYEQRKMNLRLLSVWAKGLEAIGLWYDQLLAESLGKQEQGATPLTVVNTRDLHSRAQQHQEGARDKFILNVIVERWRRQPLEVGVLEQNQDQLNAIGARSLPDLMTAALKGTNQAYRDDGRPTADLHLPVVDEYHVGQLLQMLMLATVLEGRLMGINPYGQPGVEKYKQHMKRELGL